ncbi:MAG: DUF4159 domain-containing protein [Bacteroidota bacterium]|jgi:hypothetical protein|nr:DUF4159 domain-containing protein [Bacteroidota bacterium]
MHETKIRTYAGVGILMFLVLAATPDETRAQVQSQPRQFTVPTVPSAPPQQARERAGSKFVIGRIKYDGGGDWYNDPSSELNMLRFLKENSSIDVDVRSEVFVEVGSEKLFSYPFVFMTGHGNIRLSDREAANLRNYLENGGFLYVDDDYGFDKAFRREIKKVFPDRELVELPFDHGIYHTHFPFPNGLPKIHEHDEKAPQGFGIFHEGRLVLFYTYESNLADGWADPDVHKDPEEIRRKSLQMGMNIIVWALTR